MGGSRLTATPLAHPPDTAKPGDPGHRA